MAGAAPAHFRDGYEEGAASSTKLAWRGDPSFTPDQPPRLAMTFALLAR